MPRPRAPPTPSASTDLLAAERAVDRDMESAFALPPPAVHKKPTPPVSPVDHPMTAPSPRHKRTLSGAAKSKEDLSSFPQYDLPPPPSRARKIIQMKPKPSSNSDSSEASQQAPASSPPKAASKRKQQPSATSAAGRKIARKTAHSIIERRRRSKMNEEFSVLKDMIPACEGVEMHKLAILQAGIEYVRYLEGCIKQLKGEKEAREEATAAAAAAAAVEDEDEDYEEDEDEDEDEDQEMAHVAKRTATNATTDWQYYRKPSTASGNSPGTLPSPDPSLPRLQHQQHQQQQQRPVLPSISSSFSVSPVSAPAPASGAPTPSTHLSPAFNAIHFSPDLSRNGPASDALSSTANSTVGNMMNPSPHILPLPQVSLDRRENNLSPANMSEGGAEATATAALMMLTKDRRNTHTTITENQKSSGGMSVKDLLSS